MMKKPRKAELQAVTANGAGDGRVVFRTPSGWWSRDLAEAEVADAPEAAAALLLEAQRDAEANLVVDPYLIEVARTDEGLVATRLREAIRAQGGPTIDVPGERVGAA
ncbi:DUF2849 domain-containing protein [Alsobacter sp. SYSU BS001988]|jgi:hypothetical protein